MPFEMKENRAEYWQEGALLGEVSFPALRPGVVNIDHVFVDPVLRGSCWSRCAPRCAAPAAVRW